MNAIADSGRTALLVADFYPVVTELDHGSTRGVLGRTQDLIAAARDAGTMVIFCATAFRPTHVEVSANNKLFAARRGGPAGPQDPRTMLHPALDLRDDDTIIAKHRVSAFHATALDMILRAGGIDRLAILGFATRGVVLSTVRQGADMDYRLAVIEDCCTERDAAIHDMLMRDIIPMQAEVLSAKDFAGTL